MKLYTPMAIIATFCRKNPGCPVITAYTMNPSCVNTNSTQPALSPFPVQNALDTLPAASSQGTHCIGSITATSTFLLHAFRHSKLLGFALNTVCLTKRQVIVYDFIACLQLNSDLPKPLITPSFNHFPPYVGNSPGSRTRLCTFAGYHITALSASLIFRACALVLASCHSLCR